VLLYVLLAAGALIVLGVGLPLMQRLINRVWPMTPQQEEAERFREQARRSIDRYRR
jgi:hypothetical protein